LFGAGGVLVFVQIGTSASPTLHEAQISVGDLRFVVLMGLDVTPWNHNSMYRCFLLFPCSGNKKMEEAGF
jgi:hypothetical protein